MRCCPQGLSWQGTSTSQRCQWGNSLGCLAQVSTWNRPPPLLSRGCQTKYHKKNYPLPILGPDAQTQGVTGLCSLQRLQRKVLLAPSHIWWLQRPLACGHFTLVSNFCFHMAVFSLCVCVQISIFYKDMSHCIRATLIQDVTSC